MKLLKYSQIKLSKGGSSMARILFLAQFAPNMDGVLLQSPKNAEEEYYAEMYHLKIFEVLKRYNYDFFSTHDVRHLLEHSSNYDLVWSLYNRIGFRNSEVFVQSLCEYFKLKYIGAAPNIRALVEDKSISKQLAEHIGIKTAKWVVASPRYKLLKTPPFPGPYFVKPRFGSASIGIDESSLCNDWDNALLKANSYHNDDLEIIVEQFIDGINYGVPVMNTHGDNPLIAIPRYTISQSIGGVMTYSQKRRATGGMSSHTSNDEHLNKMLMYLAKQYYMEIQPCDYARIDFLVDKKSGTPYFLEVNTLMNLSVQGGFIKSFLHNEFNSYDEIIRHIVELGVSKLK